MKLCIAHVNLAKELRGGEQQTLALMRALKTFGIEQHLFYRTSNHGFANIAKEFSYVHPLSHSINGHVRVPQLDLIHVHEARAAQWAWIEYCLRKTPYLITRRVLHPIGKNYFSQKMYQQATALIGVSNAVSDQLRTQFLGALIRTIHDSHRALVSENSQVQKIRKQLKGSPIIGQVGVIDDAVKGQRISIAAFHLLKQYYPNACLIFVGNGSDFERLRSQTQHDSQIIWAGYQEDIANWIASFDVMITPSHIEALGSSVLDAMQLKIPLITSNAGGLPELIGAQERGLCLHELNEKTLLAALLDTFQNTQQTQHRVNNAYQFAQSHDPSLIAKQYLELYWDHI